MNTFSMETTDVRQAMLACLGDPLPANCKGLSHRIQSAPDQAHLWHLREELMLVLALRRGEVWAANVLAGITAMFAGGTKRPQAGPASRATTTRPLVSSRVPM